MATKPRFTFDNHKATGAQLYAARNELTKLYVEIGRTYPLTAKSGRLAKKAITAIDELRSELENQMFKDYPEETKGHGSTKIYYPGGQHGTN